jgi:hypothetical protein
MRKAQLPDADGLSRHAVDGAAQVFQAERLDGLQAPGPATDGAEAGLGPVEMADQLTELAASTGKAGPGSGVCDASEPTLTNGRPHIRRIRPERPRTLNPIASKV